MRQRRRIERAWNLSWGSGTGRRRRAVMIPASAHGDEAQRTVSTWAYFEMCTFYFNRRHHPSTITALACCPTVSKCANVSSPAAWYFIAVRLFLGESTRGHLLYLPPLRQIADDHR